MTVSGKRQIVDYPVKVGVVMVVGGQVGDVVVLMVVTLVAVGEVGAGGRVTDAVVNAVVIPFVVAMA